MGEVRSCYFHNSTSSTEADIPKPLHTLPENTLPTDLWNKLKRKHSFQEPTRIQKHSWPILLSRQFNILQLSSTGSGKTLAYGLPLVVHLLQAKENSLVLVPTRELALQVTRELQVIETRVVAIYGGADRQSQINELKEKMFILAATPQRLLDLSKDDALQLASIKHVVLDEADRLAGHSDLCQQATNILEQCSNRITTCLCSATFPGTVQPQWNEWIAGKPCVLVEVDTIRKEAKSSSKLDFGKIPENLTQTLHVCAQHKKIRKLLTTINMQRREDGRQPSLGIIFVGKIKTLHYVYSCLQKEGIPCAQLHGQLAQREREKAVQNFKCGKLPLLVATDVAARGLHINHVRFVINYDFPGNLEQYIHRCGRAGRSGQQAIVFSFFTRNLAALAPGMIAILEATHQQVDPNLRSLVTEETETNVIEEKDDNGSPGDEDSVDSFANLNPRITLQRANVSDPSDSDINNDED